MRSSIDADAHEDAAHISYEQLAAYVDDRLGDDERELAASHFTVCHSCAAEAADLLEFRRSLEAQSDAAESAAATTEVGTFDSFISSRLAGLRRSLALAFAPRATAMVSLGLAVVALIVGAKLLSDRASTSTSDARLAQITNADAPAPRASETPAAYESNGDTQNIDTQNAQSVATTATPAANAESLSKRVPIETSNPGIERDPSSPSYARSLERVTSGEGLRFPAILASLAGTTGVLRGDADSTNLSLIYPLGEVVRSERPTFRWRSVDGAANYRVAIFDDKLNEVAVSPSLNANEWTPPRNLDRGQIYLWQITAERDGETIIAPAPPAPEAKFKVLDRRTSVELDQLQKATRDNHLLLGTLYAEAGLLADAEREFDLLRRAAPRSRLARTLSQSVKARRRLGVADGSSR